MFHMSTNKKNIGDKNENLLKGYLQEVHWGVCGENRDRNKTSLWCLPTLLRLLDNVSPSTTKSNFKIFSKNENKPGQIHLPRYQFSNITTQTIIFPPRCFDHRTLIELHGKKKKYKEI